MAARIKANGSEDTAKRGGGYPPAPTISTTTPIIYKKTKKIKKRERKFRSIGRFSPLTSIAPFFLYEGKNPHRSCAFYSGGKKHISLYIYKVFSSCMKNLRLFYVYNHRCYNT